MPDPERRFSVKEPEFAFISMAHLFTGVNYPNNSEGLRLATVVLREQHGRIMPPAPSRARLQQVVAKDEESIIPITEQMVALALDANDYAAALLSANYLYFFGDIAYKDSLGGEAFNLSLTAHRAFAKKILENFSTSDPYLKVAGMRMSVEVEELGKQGNHVRELELLRGLIHTVALNGTLGEGAKQKFDPFAVAHIE